MNSKTFDKHRHIERRVQLENMQLRVVELREYLDKHRTHSAGFKTIEVGKEKYLRCLSCSDDVGYLREVIGINTEFYK